VRLTEAEAAALHEGLLEARAAAAAARAAEGGGGAAVAALPPPRPPVDADTGVGGWETVAVVDAEAAEAEAAAARARDAAARRAKKRGREGGAPEDASRTLESEALQRQRADFDGALAPDDDESFGATDVLSAFAGGGVAGGGAGGTGGRMYKGVRVDADPDAAGASMPVLPHPAGFHPEAAPESVGAVDTAAAAAAPVAFIARRRAPASVRKRE
jgi:hypothetical protein